ncbi:MAG: hypothetical protein KGL45_08005, partial [Gammaproteobacteria bacterium]|nr:hypothetical protein [Gammaproteobacteria bacterium]
MIRLPWRRVSPIDPATLHPRGSPSEVQPAGSGEVSPAMAGAPAAGAVRGERAAFIVSGARSLQSRMTGLLAAGLMISVGAGMLAWYYT